MFACALYPTNEDFLDSVIKEVQYQVSYQEYTTTDSCYGTPTWFQIKEKKKIGHDKTKNNNKR